MAKGAYGVVRLCLLNQKNYSVPLKALTMFTLNGYLFKLENDFLRFGYKSGREQSESFLPLSDERLRCSSQMLQYFRYFMDIPIEQDNSMKSGSGLCE